MLSPYMKSIRLYSIVFALALTSFVVACGSGGGEPTAEPEAWEAPLAMADSGYQDVTDSMKRGTTNSGDKNVTIDGLAHKNLDILTGTVVKWENKDDAAHTATSGSSGEPDGSWDSGDIGPGAEYTFKFDEVGVYDYFCKIHSEMTGTITVSAIE